MNEVRLQGRVSGEPQERVLPSGDRLWSCRVVVARTAVRALPSGRRGPSVDVVDLVAWGARAQRSMARWRDGDDVAVEGALRRRFYRSGPAAASRVEVEVSGGRVVRRATPG